MSWGRFVLVVVVVVMALSAVENQVTKDLRGSVPSADETNQILAAVRAADLEFAGAEVQREHEVSAFYPCSNRVRTTEEVLRRFRRFFPLASVLMQNDENDVTLSPLAREFNATFRVVRRASWRPIRGTVFYDAQAAESYVRGLVDAAQDSQWTVLLEDDVWWLRSFSFSFSPAFDINGMNPFHQEFGGQGSSVFRSATLRALNFTFVDDEIHTMLSTNGWVASDRLMSAVVTRMGGTVGEWSGTVTWAPGLTQNVVARIRDPNTKVLHGLKIFY